MKKATLLTLAILLGQVAFGQVSGNVNYQQQVHLPDQNIEVGTPASADVYISVKGLANVQASAYVAIFSATQFGKTAEEVHALMEARLTQARTEIQQQTGAETYVDMISFVPVYELDAEKKVFSKTTYNEVPKGFELKKNIHIRYTDPSQLDAFIRSLSGQEIYDLVRVDYFSDSMERVKKELMDKARIALQAKVAHYEALVGTPLADFDKRINDGFKVKLPVEMYKSYDAFNSSALQLKKSANVHAADKSATLHYQPIADKEFDFVINPVVLEPVIQVMYEVKLVISREKQPTPTPKEYYIITPSGELKLLDRE